MASTTRLWERLQSPGISIMASGCGCRVRIRVGGHLTPCETTIIMDTMRTKLLVALTLTSFCAAQTRKDSFEHPVRQSVRGVHGAIAAGSEYATEAGMRIYYRGGNAVD